MGDILERPGGGDGGEVSDEAGCELEEDICPLGAVDWGGFGGREEREEDRSLVVGAVSSICCFRITALALLS